MKRLAAAGGLLLGLIGLALMLTTTAGCESCVDSGSLCPEEGADGCCSENCQEYNGYQICS